MSKRTKYFETKETLKTLALQIRGTKVERKTNARANNLNDLWKSERDLYRQKREFRHLHIAYCELHGTPYNLIESKVAPGNEPSRSLINEYKERLVKAIQEVA